MVLLTLLTLVLTAPDAGDYRRNVSRVDFKHCERWDAGTPIEWRMSVDGNPETPGDTEDVAIRASFATWSLALAECSSLTLREGPRSPSRHIGWKGSALELDKNENLVLFRQRLCSQPGLISPNDPCWDDEDCGNKHDCWQHDPQVIAWTLTTYDSLGRIHDADVEFNTGSFIFTTVDSPPCVPPAYAVTCIAWDVQNVMTHEIGHMFGLGHVATNGSTMQASQPVGELRKRVLDEGTKSFVCRTYAAGQASSDCVVEPVGPLGDVAPKGCGCGSAPGGLLVLLVLLLLLRRSIRPSAC
ncbi:MAG: matrixin [Myxococcaceae bacterium]|nr:matrixin [Myxococcaceae bacterium]